MQNWEYKKLGDVCDIYQPQTISSKELVENGEYPVYGANGVIGFYNKYNHEQAEVLLTCRGSTCGTVNKSVPFSWINGNAMVIHPLNDEELSKDYLIHALNFLDYSHIITGAAQPQITRVSLAPAEIPLPPLEEQKRIVKILDEKFAMLETVKANAKANLQNAKDLFQSQLTKAFSNNSWEKKTVLEVCTNIVDCPHTTPKKVNNKTDFPCIRTSELKDGFIFWDSMQYLDEEEYKKRVARLQPQENDIVFGREGSVGGAILIPHEFHFSLGQRTMLLRPNQNIIYPKYFLQVIISDFFRKQIREKMTPGGVPHINVADVKSLNVLLPPLPEQKRIVEQLDSLSEKVRSLEEIYTKQLANCDELKQAFLAKAFAGEL